jgi:hypothetical protein
MERTENQFPQSNVSAPPYEKGANRKSYQNKNIKGVKLDSNGHTDAQREEYAKQDLAKTKLYNDRNEPSIVKIDSAK